MNRIQFWLRIRKLQRIKAELYSEYKKKTVGKKGKELQRISHEYGSETDLINDEVWELHTNYIRSKAAQFIIPIPDDKSCWRKSKITGMNLLSTKGIHEMKKKIRDEYTFFLLFVTVFTGFFGAATGFFAILSK